MHHDMIGGRTRNQALRSPLLAAALVVVALLVSPRVARADFDVTNTWVVSGPVEDSCTWKFVQTGSTVEAHGTCGLTDFFHETYGDLAATIDPVTGTLAGTIYVSTYVVGAPPQDRSFTFSASVAPSGSTMSGTLSGYFTGPFFATLCQNGTVDPGEECDEGLTFGGCCTPSCTLQPDGTSCSSNQCSTATTCSSGRCIGVPKLAGTHCDLDDKPCTTDECDDTGSCVAGPCSPCCGGTDCSPSRPDKVIAPTDARASVLLQNSPTGATDRLTFVIPHAAATLPADLPDPATAGYALCVFQINSIDEWDYLTGATIPAGQMCGSRSCWKRQANGTLSYRNAKLDPDGIASLTIKPGAQGKASVRVTGRGPMLALPKRLGPVPGGELFIDLRSADVTWAAEFPLNFDPHSVDTVNELKGKKGWAY